MATRRKTAKKKTAKKKTAKKKTAKKKTAKKKMAKKKTKPTGRQKYPSKLDGYFRRQHLVESGEREEIIRYEWDDEQTCRSLAKGEALDEGLRDRLVAVSKRAVLAYAIGCFEWIVYRLDGLYDEDAPRQLLDASWALLVNGQYVWPWELDLHDWSGPVLRPLANAADMLLEAGTRTHYVYDEDDPCFTPNYPYAEWKVDPARSAANIDSLTRHLLTEHSSFQRWRDAVVLRMEQLFPRKLEDPLGPTLPPDILDMDRAFELDGREKRVDSYLCALDVPANPYLVDAEDMDLDDFPGVPYSLDIH